MKRITMMTGICCLYLAAISQTNTLPTIELQPFSSGFSNPVGIEHAGDRRLFVVEQTGLIRIINEDGSHRTTFLDLTDRVLTTGFEQGLLGLTFDPNYSTNRYFYVHYTNLEGNNQFSRFTRHHRNPDKALPGSEVMFLEDDDPFANHNSGQMKFGPDGYLYLALGDGGSGGDPMNNGQDVTTIMGKLMRIDPNPDGSYSIPPDNPYAGIPGTAEEIWATGLRNPWRFTFDSETGDLWIPDVGQNSWEEVNMTPYGTPGGINYGWSCREGFHVFKIDCEPNETTFTDPIAEYAHNNDPELPCSGSITGGYVYRGVKYADMYAKYFYADFCTGHIYTTFWDGSEWIAEDLGAFTPGAYSTFGEDYKGELYLANKSSGEIYRFVDGGNQSFQVIPEQVASPTVVGYTAAISPNPNQGDFTLHFTGSEDASYPVEIIDLMGKKVWSDELNAGKGNNQWTFDNLNLNAGYYMARILTPDGILVTHFITEKD